MALPSLLLIRDVWMEKLKFVAPCLFGVEGILSNELKRLGIEDVKAEDGRVLFTGTPITIARVNINSRFAERVMVLLGEFYARSFTELFDNVKALPLERTFPKDAAFPVSGHCLDSKLYSVPDCQSIIKKAMADRLGAAYKLNRMSETGEIFKVRFLIRKDKVSLMLDTSGEGLHKRGYRKSSSNEAPIKETLAAAICDLSRIYPDTQLYDPFCGSGTLLIESALMATNTAPGLNRAFAGEKYGFIPKEAWEKERKAAIDKIDRKVDFKACGFDISPEAVELTLYNAKKAGVEQFVRASVADIKDFKVPDERFLLVTNPPYGERLLDIHQAQQLYKTAGKVFQKKKGAKYSIITADEDFEKSFGRPCDKQRKMYNGMLQCRLYMYFKGGDDK